MRSNLDLGRIVSGRASDPIDKRAFECAFAPRCIEAVFQKIGAVPLMGERLKHRKVRHEPFEGDPGADDLIAL